MFYLSCLVDRSSSNIAFISSAQGGINIEEVAKSNPEKIVTVKIKLSKSVDESDVNKILEIISSEINKDNQTVIQSKCDCEIFKPVVGIEISCVIDIIHRHAHAVLDI